MPRTVVENETFTRMLHELGDIRRLDDVLRGVYWSLHQRAEEWPIVAGFERVRLAKTDEVGGIPRLRIWFRILSDYEVELLAIEQDPCLENGADHEDGKSD